MKRIYRGWFFGTTPDGEVQAVKRNRKIIGPTEQAVKEEIDRFELKELMEEVKNE